MTVSKLFVVLWSFLSVAGQNDPRAHAVELAKAEVARGGASRDAITILDVVEKEWRDSSLGCPVRGTTYAQVLTSGYVIRLQTGSIVHTVHVGAGRAVVCGTRAVDGRETKLPRSDAALGLTIAGRARDDLATSRGLRKDRVTIDFYRATTWPDSRLGCEGPAPSDPQPTRGFLIQLSADGKKYEYHSDADGSTAGRICRVGGRADLRR